MGMVTRNALSPTEGTPTRTSGFAARPALRVARR
jgi:hypothetical protein